MNNKQILELKEVLFPVIKKVVQDCSIIEDKELNRFYFDIKSEKDFIIIINLLGRLGAFFNIKGIPQKCRITLENYNENWKDYPAFY